MAILGQSTYPVMQTTPTPTTTTTETKSQLNSDSLQTPEDKFQINSSISLFDYFAMAKRPVSAPEQSTFDSYEQTKKRKRDEMEVDVDSSLEEEMPTPKKVKMNEEISDAMDESVIETRSKDKKKDKKDKKDKKGKEKKKDKKDKKNKKLKSE